MYTKSGYFPIFLYFIYFSAAKTVSMVGKCFLDFCHPDDRDVVRNHFSSTLREQQHISSVYRMTGLVGNNNGSIHQVISRVFFFFNFLKECMYFDFTNFFIRIY